MKNKEQEILFGGGNSVLMKSSRLVTAYQVLYLTRSKVDYSRHHLL
jgi:hypothetical protein